MHRLRGTEYPPVFDRRNGRGNASVPVAAPPPPRVAALLDDEAFARGELVHLCTDAWCRLIHGFFQLRTVLVEEALALLQIEASAMRQSLEDDYVLFIGRATRFHHIKTINALVASCEPEHRNIARWIWVCQALTRNEMYSRCVAVEQCEIQARRDVLVPFFAKAIMPLFSRYAPPRVGRLRGPTRPPTEYEELIDRLGTLRLERARGMFANKLYETQLAHDASRTRLEWQEELEGKAVRFQVEELLRLSAVRWRR